MDAAEPRPPALVARGIRKQYGGVHALAGVDISIPQAEVHAILGENGAGKSTLVKIIAGVVRPDRGEIVVDGRPLTLGSPQESRNAGIAVVFQELSLVPQLSVTHNLVLSKLPLRKGLVSLRNAEAIAQNALAKLGLDNIDPWAPVSSLPLDQRQMVEITKATMAEPRILILDEATSSLGDAEVERLFDLVRALRDRGTTVVVITHRMHEVWALADTMTVLRDGHTVGRSSVVDTDPQRTVSLMAGRDIKAVFPDKDSTAEREPALELRNVSLHRGQKPWQLTLYKGEILGLGGLQGQGQRQFLHWLYGVESGEGTILRDGAAVKIRKPAHALRHGVVLIPEDRAVEGLHLNLPVRWNLSMATLDRWSRLGILKIAAEKRLYTSAVSRMSIKVRSGFQPASALSGGSQQKVVIGKFMEVHPSVLLFVDSTRGIDVQTKFDFYEMLRSVAREGASCVLYSSDTEELVGLCDRVAVFHDGVPALMLEGAEITQDAVVAASFAVVRGRNERPRRPGAPSRRSVRRFAWQRSYTAAALALILFLIYLVRNHGFGSIEALGITNAALPLALAAAGETFAILSNGIDLSIGSVITLANVLCAVIAGDGHAPAGVIVALVVGAAAGLLNGLIISFARIAPLIATLATSSIYIGCALIVLPIPGGSVPGWVSKWTAGSVGVFPVAVFWLALAIVVGWVILRRTSFGINLQALGGSESASRSAGVNVTRTRILAYVASGTCAALAGVVLAGLTQSGDATIGSVYLLDAIAAVVVGGTSLAGGVGTISGSILGAISLALISAVLLVSGLSTDYQYIVTGLIVIGALLAHSLQSAIGLRTPRRPRIVRGSEAG